MELGFDSATPPSPDLVKTAASQHGASFWGVYIGGACMYSPDPNHGPDDPSYGGWNKQRVLDCARAGISHFLPIYVGQQAASVCRGANNLTRQQGEQDGADAIARMKKFGWGPGTPCALDIEADTGRASGNGVDPVGYTDAFCGVLYRAGYVPGVYGFPDFLEQLWSQPNRPHFVYAVNWLRSGNPPSYPAAEPRPGVADLDVNGVLTGKWKNAWVCQYVGNTKLQDLDVDINMATVTLAPVPGTAPVQRTVAWGQLGGQVEGGLATACNQDGRLEVLVRGTDAQLYHRFQTGSNNGWSPAWQSLGGQLTGRILALANHDGRLALFARGTDTTLWHQFQTAPNQGWSGWLPLDQDPTARVPIDDLFSGTRTGQGTLALVARRLTDGVLLQRAQQQAGGGWSAWTPVDPQLPTAGTLAVAQQPDGRLVVVSTDGQGQAYVLTAQAPDSWTASRWQPLGSTPVRPLLALDHTQDGRLVAFAQGTDGALWHLWQQQPSGAWGADWTTLGGQISQVLATGFNLHGRLEVFTRGQDGALWHLKQEQPNSWTGSTWRKLGGAVDGLLAVAVNQDGHLEVFVRDPTGQIQHCWQYSPGHWT